VVLLHVYVDTFQLGDWGSSPLHIGMDIPLTLVGNPGSTLGVGAAPLNCYLSNRGKVRLVRTGLAEYAFCGRIIEVKRDEPMGKLVYQEVLIDCGVPIIFATDGYPGFVPILDLDDPGNKESSPGRYLSGLMLLDAHISYRREPVLIEQEVRARLTSLATVDLLPDAKTLAGLLEMQSVDSLSAKLPLIMGIEV